jgi:hypothetical protein
MSHTDTWQSLLRQLEKFPNGQNLTVVILELGRTSRHSAALADFIVPVEIAGRPGFRVNVGVFRDVLGLERVSSVSAVLAADGYVWECESRGSLAPGWECYAYERRVDRRVPAQSGVVA